MSFILLCVLIDIALTLGDLYCTLIESTTSVHLTSAHDLWLLTHACTQIAKSIVRLDLAYLVSVPGRRARRLRSRRDRLDFKSPLGIE